MPRKACIQREARVQDQRHFVGQGKDRRGGNPRGEAASQRGRLTLLDLYDGQQEQVVLTGAPNIFHLKGTGKLPKPIKVAYAKEGVDDLRRSRGWARADHAQTRENPRRGFVLDGLFRKGTGHYRQNTKASSCSTTMRPSGMPLVDYMGDAVLDITILPNMARNANVIGVARELSALLGRELKKTIDIKYQRSGNVSVTNWSRSKSPTPN